MKSGERSSIQRNLKTSDSAREVKIEKAQKRGNERGKNAEKIGAEIFRRVNEWQPMRTEETKNLGAVKVKDFRESWRSMRSSV